MKQLFILNLISLFLLTSCSSLTKQQLDQRKTGIIDACYTVLEYNSQNKEQKIQKYLNQKIEQDLINKEQKIIIKKCLYRTQNSERWNKK